MAITFLRLAAAAEMGVATFASLGDSASNIAHGGFALVAAFIGLELRAAWQIIVRRRRRFVDAHGSSEPRRRPHHGADIRADAHAGTAPPTHGFVGVGATVGRSGWCRGVCL